jgi:Na+/H+ antiporter NhaD/arsenite permease-like protein
MLLCARAHASPARQLEKADWDTLLFFYGVILCVGALALLGYLDVVSRVAYSDLGPSLTNVLVGLLSAIVDNIPVSAAEGPLTL